MANYPSTANYEEKYEETELLGEGGFGKVFKVKQRLGDEVFASKHIKTVKKKGKGKCKSRNRASENYVQPLCNYLC